MDPALRSVLLGTAGLSAALLAAAWLTLARGGLAGSPAGVRRTVRLALVAIAVQAAHFAEELATGFPERFPELLGLAPWPPRLFVPFNLLWIAAWLASAALLSRLPRAALLPLWFLAVASVANGVAHPLLAAAAGGYFPGLVTSPLLGLAGLLLLRRLARETRGPRAAPRGAG